MALLNSSVVWAWTLSPEATIVKPFGRMESQSEGVSKTDGERYPMRAFQPDMSYYSSTLMFFSGPSKS